MKRFKAFLLLAFIGLLFVTKTSFALPFSIVPYGPLPTTVESGSEAQAFYTVTNITNQAAPSSFVKFLPPNVKQVIDTTDPTLCSTLFNLAPAASCKLQLVVAGPVNAKDPNPEHHLFVCRQDGKTCAGPSEPLNVVTIKLLTITVSPSVANLTEGQTQQFTAIGHFSDGSTPILTNVTWSSSNLGVATINATTGLATALHNAGLPGFSTITATRSLPLPVVSGTATLNLTPLTLVSIAVLPAVATIPRGASQGFTAIGTFSDFSTHVLPDANYPVVWSLPGAPLGLAISALGLVTTNSSAVIGSYPIHAQSGAIGSIPDATLTLSNPALVSISITPVAATIPVGGSTSYTAIGTYADGSTADITTSVTWNSSILATAYILSGALPNGGKATGVAAGNTTITANVGLIVSNLAPLTVTNALLTAITIAPTPTATVLLGGQLTFTAMGTYATGPSPLNITQSVIWNSSDLAVASISSGGLTAGTANGLNLGTSNITASMSGITSPITVLTVAPVNPQTIFAGTNLPTPNIYKSADSGAVWDGGTAVGAAQIAGLSSADGNVYAALPNNTVFHSYNSGTLWTAATTSPTAQPNAILAVPSSNVYVGLQNGNVCYSTDLGVNFTCVLAIAADPILSLAYYDTFVYAGAFSGQICRSSTFGLGWGPCPSTGASPVNAVATSLGHVFGGTTSGKVCISTDNGVTYPICNNVAGIPSKVNALVTDPSGHLFAGLLNGEVCVSHNNGNTFDCQVAYLAGNSVLSLAVDANNTVYAGTASGNVCSSSDLGMTWLCPTVGPSPKPSAKTVYALTALVP